MATLPGTAAATVALMIVGVMKVEAEDGRSDDGGQGQGQGQDPPSFIGHALQSPQCDPFHQGPKCVSLIQLERPMLAIINENLKFRLIPELVYSLLSAYSLMTASNFLPKFILINRQSDKIVIHIVFFCNKFMEEKQVILPVSCRNLRLKGGFSYFSDQVMGGAFPFSDHHKYPQVNFWEIAPLKELIKMLNMPKQREQALCALCKRRATDRDLGLLIWRMNAIFILLSEVTGIYKFLTPEKLKQKDYSRVCNAITILECVASHSKMKMVFLKARIPHYLFPLLKTCHTEKPFQFLRHTSLRAIGSLIKDDDAFLPNCIYYFLESEVVPLCLHCIELGDAHIQSVAVFIIHKILTQKQGMSYVSAKEERFCAILDVFGCMIERMANQPSPQILRSVIQCYAMISKAPRSREKLRYYLPLRLRTPAFLNCFCDDRETQDDMETLHNLQRLFQIVAEDEGGSSSEPGKNLVPAAKNNVQSQ